MRHYGDADSGGYDTMQQQHMKSEQQQQHHHNQWRWERESPQIPTNAMSPNMFPPQGQGSEASRSYYQQGQRSNPRLELEKEGGKDPRAQSREENMDIGYEDNRGQQQTLEALELRFLDDILKLTKEQNDAEDAENSRHRERINAINGQYQEQLVALRARHAGHRDEVLRRESHARKQQYQQVALDSYPPNNSNARGYVAMNSPAGERQAAAYNAETYDSYRERARFPGGGRDHGYEPRGQYPTGRAYDTASRYY